MPIDNAGRNSSPAAKGSAARSRSTGARRALLVRTSVLAVIVAAALLLSAASPQNARDSKDGDIDRTVKPGDDFYQYANGNWLATATIPPGQSSFDTRAILMERTAKRVRELIREAALSNAPKGSVPQKVGDYYSSFMDEGGIEDKNMKPLADEMAMISAITNNASLSAYLGTTLNSEVDGLINNSDHVFGWFINQGFEDTDHNVVHLLQGGLGLPDRDNYLDASPKMAETRAKYQKHVAAILKMAGTADSETSAARVLALETRMAQAFAPDADAADVFKQNNPWKRADFAAKAPGMDWESYFKAAGLLHQSDFIVWQPSAVIGISALIGSESAETWKDYLRFHLIEHYAGVLPKAVRDEDFVFYGTALTGAQQPPERINSAIAATNGALGMAVGQIYAQRYFPPEAKAKVKAMVGDVISAYRARIPHLAWMSAPTKKKALDKLAALEVLVGYPDLWVNYSTLQVVRGDAFGNMRRAEAFLHTRNLAKLRQPVDPVEWPVNPQIPGAVILFSPNVEMFSAALFQPPYFDPDGDSASNYGSAGAGLAHEVSHSFDDLGNIYDAHGKLGDWWTAEDRTQYRAAAAKLVAQLDGYCPFADLCVKGKQVLTESIADQAGLLTAHDAYILSLKGKPDVVIGGLTGEQRFFLAFAQRWRKAQTEDALRHQVATDTHPPGRYRSNSVRNVDAWYDGFGVAAGDKLYLRPEDRVLIW